MPRRHHQFGNSFNALPVDTSIRVFADEVRRGKASRELCLSAWECLHWLVDGPKRACSGCDRRWDSLRTSGADRRSNA